MNNRYKKAGIAGYIMAICGMICIFITGLNYLFGWKLGLPPAAIGIVFLGTGMAAVRKSRKKENGK
jgi:hypothetical protein